MDIKLLGLLLLNCAIIVANCQTTISHRDDCTHEQQSLDDMKSEMDSMRQVLMDLKQAVVRSETETRQRIQSEISEMREVFAQQQYWSRNECPPGFEYESTVGSCYRVIFERMTWDAATERCRQMMPGAHLAVITSQLENDAIVKYLQSKASGNSNKCTQVGQPWVAGGDLIWIGGQTKNPRRCGDYVWRPLKGIEIPHDYSNWNPGYPDCYEGGENCLQITTGLNYTWNDHNCTWLSCAICELHVHV